MSLDTLRAGLATAPPRPRRGRLVIAAAAVALVLAMAAAVWARTTAPRVVSAAQTAGRRHPPAAPSTTSTTAAPARVWPTTTTTAAASSTPLVVVHAGASYAVGAVGDRVFVGRFRCGAPVPALVRADGDIFVFATWAVAGADVVGAPIGHVDNGRDVRIEDADGDGCDELVVVRADGTSERLTP